jgi:glycyl-tRNA synthetase beta chain
LQDEEKVSYVKFVDADAKINDLLAAGKFEEVLKELVSLSAVLSVYVEKVLVMHQDPNVKANRLAFLGLVNQLFRLVFDAEKIV